MDLSFEAIDADLATAESAGVGRGQIALVRARIRATLIASQRAQEPAPGPNPPPPFLALPTEHGSADIQIAEGPFGDSYAVPAAAVWADRVEAASRLLGVDLAMLVDLFPEDGPRFSVELGGVHFTERQWKAVQVSIIPVGGPAIEAPTDPDEDDPDVDFFDEARKARKS